MVSETIMAATAGNGKSVINCRRARPIEMLQRGGKLLSFELAVEERF
jgi:hypothetical protein